MTQTFDALWERSAPKLRKFAYSLAKNRDDAEDLVSDAYVKCRRSFNGVRDTKVFEIYAFRAVHRLHIDEVRRPRAVSLREAARYAFGNSGRDHPDDIEDRIPEQTPADTTLPEVERVLNWMGPKERTITQLRMMGLEFHEIGEAMGLTTTAVKSRHRRLRHHLWKAGYAA
jgi:RNA polymerase sigma-70 factor (ECF subfamily)